VPRERQTPPQGPLASTVISGLSWLTVANVLGKACSLAAQIALARLLSPEQFAYAGIALTVASFGNLLCAPGLEEILGTSPTRFRRWRAAASRLAAWSGAVSAAVILVLGLVAARAYGYAPVAGLAPLCAATTFAAALAVVPMARWRSELRFPLLAGINAAQAVAAAALTILCAYIGWGAASFVAPRLLTTLALVAALLLLAAPRLETRTTPRRRRVLMAQMTTLLSSRALFAWTVQGDNLILAAFVSPREVGIYFFAYTLAMQPLQLVSTSVATVLLPSFGRLDDEPARLVDALRRSTRAMSFVGVVACATLAVFAPEVVVAVFGAKWRVAAPCVRWLCAGAAFNTITWSGGSLMLARGRFRLYARLALACAGLFTALVAWGAGSGGAVGVSIGVCAYLAISSIVGFKVSAGTVGLGWRNIVPWLGPAAVGGVAVAAAGGVARHLLLDAGTTAWTTLVAGTAVATLAAVAACRVASKDLFDELCTAAAKLARGVVGARTRKSEGGDAGGLR